MNKYPRYKVAAVNSAPVFLNTRKTVQKACDIIEQLADNNVKLAAFPEVFIPAFPIWSAIRGAVQNHEFFYKLAREAVHVNGPEVEKIRDAAQRCRMVVSIGINELSEVSVAGIWNSNIIIGADGSILNHHRKIMPTYWERMTWSNGDGAGLRVIDGELGKIGMLICGENTNPLARFSLMAQGEQVHISSFPSIWPAHDPDEDGAYDISEAITIRVRNHAFEGKLFNIVSGSYAEPDMIEQLSRGDKEVERILNNCPQGLSCVVGPDGNIISDVVKGEEGVAYAEIDIERCLEQKELHDLTGYYNRFDIFRLTVDRRINSPVSFIDDPIEAKERKGVMESRVENSELN